MSTHKQGIEIVDAIVTEYGIEDIAHELRWFASQHMSQTMPELEEIGSSDVSIHLSELARHQPELLREEAERLRDRQSLVRQVAAHSGKSEAEALRDLRRLMATDDD